MPGNPDEIDDEVERQPGVTEVDVDQPVPPIDIDNPDVIGTARRRYGGAGAVLAAGMFGLDVALTDKKKPDSVQVQEAPTDPVDVDSDGIQVIVDETLSVNAPALERLPLIGLGKKKSRRG